MTWSGCASGKAACLESHVNTAALSTVPLDGCCQFEAFGMHRNSLHQVRGLVYRAMVAFSFVLLNFCRHFVRTGLARSVLQLLRLLTCHGVAKLTFWERTGSDQSASFLDNLLCHSLVYQKAQDDFSFLTPL